MAEHAERIPGTERGEQRDFGTDDKTHQAARVEDALRRLASFERTSETPQDARTERSRINTSLGRGKLSSEVGETTNGCRRRLCRSVGRRARQNALRNGKRFREERPEEMRWMDQQVRYSGSGPARYHWIKQPGDWRNSQEKELEDHWGAQGAPLLQTPSGQVVGSGPTTASVVQLTDPRAKRTWWRSTLGLARSMLSVESRIYERRDARIGTEKHDNIRMRSCCETTLF